MKRISRALLCLLILQLSACGSMQAVSLHDVEAGIPPPGVDVGSQVRVTTRAGDRIEFRVTDIETAGLGYRSGFVPYRNMSRLEVHQPGANEDTTRIVLGILGIGALIALLNSADSVAVCSPAPCSSAPR